MERAKLENVHFKVPETLVQCAALVISAAENAPLVIDISEFGFSLTRGHEIYYDNFFFCLFFSPEVGKA